MLTKFTFIIKESFRGFSRAFTLLLISSFSISISLVVFSILLYSYTAFIEYVDVYNDQFIFKSGSTMVFKTKPDGTVSGSGDLYIAGSSKISQSIVETALSIGTSGSTGGGWLDISGKINLSMAGYY